MRLDQHGIGISRFRFAFLRLLDVRDLFGHLATRVGFGIDVDERVACPGTSTSTSCFHPRVAVVVGCGRPPSCAFSWPTSPWPRPSRRASFPHPSARAVFTIHRDVEDAFQLLLDSIAFSMSFSLPAKCSQVLMIGKGFSPANRRRSDGSCAHGHSLGSLPWAAGLAALRLYHVLRTALQRTPDDPHRGRSIPLRSLRKGRTRSASWAMARFCPKTLRIPCTSVAWNMLRWGQPRLRVCTQP